MSAQSLLKLLDGVLPVEEEPPSPLVLVPKENPRLTKKYPELPEMPGWTVLPTIPTIEGPPLRGYSIHDLRKESAALIAAVEQAVAHKLGLGGREALRLMLINAVRWAEQKSDPERPFAPLAKTLARRACYEFLEKYGQSKLDSERLDERWRYRASKDDVALTKYLDFWRDQLSLLSKTHPGRWRVPGLSREELHEELLLQLLAAVRKDPDLESLRTRGDGSSRIPNPGVQVTYDFLEARKNKLKRVRRLFIVPDSISLPRWASTSPSAPAQIDEAVRQEAIKAVIGEARACLSRTNQKWFDAYLNEWRYLSESNETDDATEWGVLTRVARTMRRHRASATRARDAFKSVLVKLRAQALLEEE